MQASGEFLQGVDILGQNAKTRIQTMTVKKDHHGTRPTMGY